MKKLFLFVLGAVLIVSCGTLKQVSVMNYATPLAPDAPVQIIGIGQKVPAGAELLGSVRIGDTGFTMTSSYEDEIKDLQKQARGMGGNLAQILWHKEPNLIHICHRLQADIYLVKTLPKN